MKKGRLVRVVGVCLLWLLLLSIFLYMTFPTDYFIRWVENRIEEKINAEVSIEGMSLQRNLSLFIERIDFKKDLGQGILNIPLYEVSLEPDIGMLIRGIPVFRFRGRAVEGSFEGDYDGSKGKKVVLSWKGMNIDNLKLPWRWNSSKTLGIANGEADLSILEKDKGKGSEFINLKIEGFDLSFNELKLPPIAISPKEVIYGRIKVVRS